MDQTNPTPFLAPCVNEDAQAHFRHTVTSNIPKSVYSTYIDKDWGKNLYLWGVREGNVRYWNQITKGDLLLFYTETGMYTHAARVRDTQHKSDFGEAVYTEADDPFHHLIYLEQPFEVDIPSAEFHDYIGYGRDFPINFTSVGDERLQALKAEFGSVRQYIRTKRLEGAGAPAEDLAAASEELHEQTNQEPALTEQNDTYTTQKRRARKAAFRQEVTNVYDERCAVCGQRRESPQGPTEFEAAHIYPRSENGTEDIRNGIALCQLHHWAFDSGWLALNNNYELIVADRSDLEGYEEFADLAGEEIQLPEQRKHWPHPKFLEAHRDLHGFEHSR